MLTPWHLPWDKIALLTLSGALVSLFIWVVWLLDIGAPQVADILARGFSGAAGTGASAGDPGFVMRLEAAVVDNALGIPLLFLQPICMRYAWSANRCLAATLVVSLRNAAWGGVFALVLIPVTMAMYAFPVDNVLDVLVLMGADLVLGLLASAVCVVVLNRSLPVSLSVHWQATDEGV
jgi:hypothetical protein